MKFYRQAKLEVRLRNDNFSGYVRTLEIEGLRVNFSVQKSESFTTNAAVVKVWNLNFQYRNLIKDYGDQIKLWAGYEREGGYQILYVGDTTAVSHIFDLPDIVSNFECGDGEKYINQLRIPFTYEAGTKARQIIKDIAAYMSIPFDEFSISNDLKYEKSYSYIGTARDSLSKVCAYLNLQWSVQNEQLQVLPMRGTIVQPTIFINENTGMQGIPQRFTYKRLFLFKGTDAPTSGYKVNVALNPFILPGSKIQLQSTKLGINVPCRVEAVRHDGDTFGPIWSTNLELTELDATV